MNLSSKIGRKGQVTIPIEVRRRLGLKEGERLEFVLEDGRTILRPSRSQSNPFEAYLGVLPAFPNRSKVNAWVRDLRAD